MQRTISILLLFLSISASAREQIRIVGSATLYPFITIAAEKFGKTADHTPVVEATGTGGGFRLLCSGNSLKYPDIVNASRPIKPSEEKFCKKNSVNNIKKITLGYDGIILAQSIEAKKLDLSPKHIFLAIAKKIPFNGKMIDNPYKTWKEIDPSLPDYNIEIYGPSFTSGTRDTFVELIMHNFCASSDEISKIIPNKKERLITCGTMREDGPYIDMSENYNLIIQKLLNNEHALGIISFSLLEEHPKIKAADISHVTPSKDSITSGEYILSRPLFLYINLDHKKFLPDLDKFINYITSPISIGPNGYLTKKGLLTKETANL
ncbi:MAG: substrate-binding domain-containing protein [Rickettsiales bacterium]|jgi:phosphate transport system substrate-binding protein|nr:substrate-binding domain-containing protein [Rickettsiales bacterium]